MKKDNTYSEDFAKKAWLSIKYLIITGVGLVICTSLYSNNCHDVTCFYEISGKLGFGLLLAGSSFAIGGFLGFIFGIPSLLQNQNLPSTKVTTFKYNDNLIQISDWLTKVIVGVGLVELTRIPRYLLKACTVLGKNLGEDPTWGRNASLVIILYFFCFGFLILYFWTRTDFTKIIKLTDDEINSTEEKNEISETKTQIEIEKNDFASTTDKLNNLITRSSSPQDLKDLQMLVRYQVKRPVNVPDDLQKGRWGGKSELNDKMISASVIKATVKGFFKIDISVFSTNQHPLDQPVAIFVHETFNYPDNVVYVIPDNEGIANLTLVAYEAFTLGALFNDKTELELDLNQQPGYPEDFYWKD